MPFFYVNAYLGTPLLDFLGIVSEIVTIDKF